MNYITEIINSWTRPAARRRAVSTAWVERLAAAKKGTGFARAGLRQAEYRLALLRGSRRWIAAGQPPA